MKPFILLSISLLISFGHFQQKNTTLAANLPFGVIDDSYQVNAAGAYNHIIPIYTPEGINGLKPQLSLIYDNRSKFSEFGLGWGLTGLSKIYRGGNNIAQQGKTEGISFTSEDAFFLDGQYLSCIAGKNGADQSLYHTESETFQVIKGMGSLDASNSSPDRFLVKLPSGLRYFYGETDNSKLSVAVDDTHKEIIEWHITRMEDPFGNFIRFNYSKKNNKIYISSIEYTGNTTQNFAPSNTIVFNYRNSARKNPQVSFISGLRIVDENIIESIEIRNESGPFKWYFMAFDENDEKLQSVKEAATKNGSESLPPTTFSYYKVDSLNFNRQKSLAIDLPKDLANAAVSFDYDFNNDGQKDLATFKEDKKDGTSHFVCQIVTDVNAGGSRELAKFDVDEMANLKLAPKMIVSDLNGDYLPDIVAENKIFLNHSTPTAASFQAVATDSTKNLITSADFSLIPIDLDGDNNSELVSLRKDKNHKVLGLKNNDIKTLFTCTFAIDNYIIGDFDGNGKTDLLMLNNNAPEAQLLTHVNGVFKLVTFKLPKAFSATGDVRGIDANRDGITDLLLNSKNAAFEVWLNEGGKFSGTSIVSKDIFNNDTSRVVFQELVESNHWSFFTLSKANKIAIWNFCMKGADKGEFEKSAVNVSLNQNVNLFDILNVSAAERASVQDLDNSGRNDIVYIKPDSLICFEASPVFPEKMQSSVNGFGRGVFISYSTTGNKGVYDRSLSDLDDAYRYIDEAYLVVSSIAYTNGLINGKNNDSLSSINYFYKDLIAETHGRGLSGFRNFSMLDKSTGIKTVTDYAYEFPQTGKILRQQKLSKKGVVIFSQENSWITKNYKEGQEITNEETPVSGFTPRVLARFLTAAQTFSAADRISINGLTQLKPSVRQSVLPKLINDQKVKFDVDRLLSDNKKELLTGALGVTASQKILSYVKEFNKTKLTYLVVLDKAKTIKRELDNGVVSSISVSNKFDGFGNLVSANSVFASGDQLHSGSSYKSFTSISDNGLYKLGLKTSDTTTTALAGADPSKPRITTYEYNGTNGNLQKMQSVLSDQSINRQSEFEYDNFGNIVTRSVFKTSANKQIDRISYTADHRFISSVQNSIGQTISYEYEPLYGKVSSKQDVDGLKTTYAYDKFGNLTEQAYPNGVKYSFSYEFFAKESKELVFRNFPNQICYKVTTTPDLASPSVVYYNKLGKEKLKFYSLLTTKLATDGSLLSTAERSVLEQTNYDERGNIIEKYDPVYVQKIANLQNQCLLLENVNRSIYSFSYDEFNRLIKSSLPDGRSSETVYTANKKTAKNTAGQVNVTLFNEKLMPVSTIDDAKNVLKYTYDSWGNLTEVNNGNTKKSVTEYDELGRKISNTDESYGKVSYKYDEFDRIISQSDNNKASTFVYDLLGRLKEKTIPEGAIKFVYDSDKPGKISSITSYDNSKRTYSYDAFSRVIQENAVIGNETFSMKYEYDNASKLSKKIYPDGYSLNYTYDNNIPIALTGGKAGTQETLWRLLAVNARGQQTEKFYGNGVESHLQYNDKTGLLENFKSVKQQLIVPSVATLNCAPALPANPLPLEARPVVPRGGVDPRRVTPARNNGSLQAFNNVQFFSGTADIVLQDQSFSYNELDNLSSFSDRTENRKIDYSYDNLNRVTEIVESGSVAKQTALQYDVLGNITKKSDLGSFEYDDQNPYKLKSIFKDAQLVSSYTYDQFGNITSVGNEQRLTYASFNKPITIKDQDKEEKLSYDFSNSIQLKTIKFSDGTSQTLTKPFPDYEVFKSAEKGLRYHYIGVGSEIFAVRVEGEVNSQSADATAYILNDYIGSASIVTDNNGNAIKKYHYDAFGEQSVSGTTSPFDNVQFGFTGHDQEPFKGIIDASGRFYNSHIGRFMSPDPFVQDPFSLQSFNRYSYVKNNPVNNTDPSGYWGIHLPNPFHVIRDVARGVVDVAKGVVHAAVAVADAVVSVHERLIEEAGHFVDKYGKQILIIAAAAAITVVSGGTLAGFAAAVAYGALIGGGVGALVTAINGGSFTDILNGALSGAVTGATAAAVAYAAGAGFSKLGISYGKEILGGFNGYSQTHNVGGIAKGIAASFIPPDLGLGESIGNSAAISMAVYTGSQALKGYIINGEQGAKYQVLSSIANQAVGHAVGLWRSDFSSPKFYRGAWVYQSTDGVRPVSIGGVITFGAPGQMEDKDLFDHEFRHFSQQNDLGLYYLPAHAVSQKSDFFLEKPPYQSGGGY